VWTPALDVIQGMKAEYVHTSIPPGRVFFAPYGPWATRCAGRRPAPTFTPLMVVPRVSGRGRRQGLDVNDPVGPEPSPDLKSDASADATEPEAASGHRLSVEEAIRHRSRVSVEFDVSPFGVEGDARLDLVRPTSHTPRPRPERNGPAGTGMGQTETNRRALSRRWIDWWRGALGRCEITFKKAGGAGTASRNPLSTVGKGRFESRSNTTKSKVAEKALGCPAVSIQWVLGRIVQFLLYKMKFYSYFTLGRPKRLDRLTEVEVSVQDRRARVPVVIVDDRTFPYERRFRKHDFNITKLDDVSNIKTLKEYGVIICDIQGFGYNLSYKYEGAHIIKEVKKDTQKK